MNIKFANELLDCRSVQTYPSHFRLGDILIGPEGMLLKVVTVQPNCPIWESSTKTKTAVVLKTEDGQIVPTTDLSGTYSLLRPRRK